MTEIESFVQVEYDFLLKNFMKPKEVFTFPNNINKYPYTLFQKKKTQIRIIVTDSSGSQNLNFLAIC